MVDTVAKIEERAQRGVPQRLGNVGSQQAVQDLIAKFLHMYETKRILTFLNFLDKPMDTIILLLAVVVAVIAILAILKAKSQGGGDDEVWPFYAKKLLSQPEQVLYFRLVQALPEHIVLAQVQLSRFLGVKKGNNYWAWFNRINRMSADFVVCNKDFSIVAVIELDDATHQKEDRQAADAKKDKALVSANIRMVRWQAKAIPDIATIQSTLIPNIAVKRDAPQAAITLP